MEITKELRELARFDAASLPVVSVYLNTQWRDQHQRERAASFLKDHFRQAELLTTETPEAQTSLAADLTRLEDWAERLLQGAADTPSPGRVVFACSGADLWVELPAPVPFEDEFVIADGPVLRQLARLDEDYTNALVVLIDSHVARICEVVLGGLLSETEFSRDFPGRHKQGGWAQMRYQRHVKDHMDRHHKEVADYLAVYLTEHPKTSIILSGQNDILSNFRHFLSTPVQQQILDTVRLDMREASDRIVEAAQAVLERHEREEERAAVERLLNRAASGGLAVVGMQQTLAAVNQGRVHQLIMHRDLHQTGWRCGDCNSIGEDTPSQCPACGSEVTAIDLGEAMVDGVLRLDGFVELIEPHPRLAAYEGVGALLRYK